MKRRKFLLAAGIAGGGGLANLFGRRTDGVRVTVWLSRPASEYESLHSRIRGYLHRALDELFDSVEIAFREDPVVLSAEEGREVMAVEWPRKVIENTVKTGRVKGVGEVDLLVTDGDPWADPAGYGTWTMAAVTGARYLGRMPTVEETPPIVDYGTPAAVMQLLLHECGHAIGLAHRHGSVVADDEAITASPMVGSYAWSSGRIGKRLTSRGDNACGHAYPDPSGMKRRLALTYSPCARRAAARTGLKSGITPM